MTKETKVLALKDATVSDSGEFDGHGAVFGNVDDGRDVILPGFFEPVLVDFMSEGFISWGHRWDEPVAMPTKAEEDAIGLALGAQFHGTANAQEKRQITSERLAAGKSMGLSIGYEVADDGEEYRDDGVRLLKTASRLFEVSLVLVPMNRLAGVSSVKDGLRFVEQADQVLGDVRALIDRTSAVARPRKEGRVLSSANRTRLEQLLEALAAAHTDIGDLLASTDPDGDKALARAAEVEWLYDQAVADGLIPPTLASA